MSLLSTYLSFGNEGNANLYVKRAILFGLPVSLLFQFFHVKTVTLATKTG